MRSFTPFGRQFEGPVPVRVDEPIFPQAPDGLCDRRRRNFKPLGQQGRNDRMAFAFGFYDGLKVVFFRNGDLLRHSCKLTTVKATLSKR